MELTEYSRNLFLRSLQEYDVAREYAEPIYNYFVYGFGPGSFFTSLLANDATGAIMRSHPANDIGALKSLVLWLENSGTRGTAWGNYDIVDNWLRVTDSFRRAVLECRGLVYTQEQEIMLALQGEKTQPVVLF